MPLSQELQMGKAGEHLVCADLILQGFSAFLADQGLPYDIICDVNGIIYRVQVRSTSKLFVSPRSPFGVYRFGLRCAKKGMRRQSCNDVDVFAFVALDIRRIAYLPSPLVVTKHGDMKLLMEFHGREADGSGKSINGYPLFPIIDNMVINQPDMAPLHSFMLKGRTYRVVNPDGVEQTVERISRFCKENGLNLNAMMNVANGTSSNHQGWGCQRLFKKGGLMVCDSK